ncbi:DUF2996 domain-containing protein [Synechocystis sp. FACHB-383]|nr:DUF2996 domain-containing protein [Synechocystis sp. FACHB-383]MBD2654868.1 DUF2996 domain-containing protein [Synechocystis sp. FACHB-383]
MTEAKAPAEKKAKPPAVEDKPFTEFIQQDFLPALQSALGKIGLGQVALDFNQNPLAIPGADNTAYWQVQGTWSGDRQIAKQFSLYFFQEDIKGPKGFAYSVDNRPPSTLESFMIDERKVTLDLMVLYILQRLNGQKWLGGN